MVDHMGKYVTKSAHSCCVLPRITKRSSVMAWPMGMVSLTRKTPGMGSPRLTRS